MQKKMVIEGNVKLGAGRQKFTVNSCNSLHHTNKPLAAVNFHTSIKSKKITPYLINGRRYHYKSHNLDENI